MIFSIRVGWCKYDPLVLDSGRSQIPFALATPIRNYAYLKEACLLNLLSAWAMYLWDRSFQKRNAVKDMDGSCSTVSGQCTRWGMIDGAHTQKLSEFLNSTTTGLTVVSRANSSICCHRLRMSMPGASILQPKRLVATHLTPRGK